MPMIENSMVAPVKERWATCSCCNQGQVLMDDPKEFWPWLGRKIIHEKLNTQDILRITHQWKATSKVDCEQCGGSSQVKVFE